MLIVSLDELFSGFMGMIFGVIGLVMFFILILFTNYVSVGVAGGLCLAGIISFLTIISFIINMLKGEDKKEKKKAIILLVIVLLCSILSYFFPLYIQGLKISFSRIASIFAEPLIVYALISIYLMSSDANEGFWWVVTKILSVISCVLLGVFITGIAYFINIKGVLDFLNSNFTYEDRRILNFRELEYESQSFEEIFPKILAKQKELRDSGKISQESIMEKFTEKSMNIDVGYYVIRQEKYDEGNNYILTIEDKARYDENNNFPRYYVVVNLDTLEVIEFRKNSAGITDDEVAEKLEKIENFDEIDGYDYMYYTLNKLKVNNKEITCENLSYEANYLKNNDIMCYQVNNINDGTFEVILANDTYHGIETKTFIAKSDYTYEAKMN